MSETQQITPEELTELQTVQQRSNLLLQELGDISLQRIMLDERSVAAEKFLQDTRQQETALSNRLQEAYGRVNINTETGEITPLS